MRLTKKRYLQVFTVVVLLLAVVRWLFLGIAATNSTVDAAAALESKESQEAPAPPLTDEQATKPHRTRPIRLLLSRG